MAVRGKVLFGYAVIRVEDRRTAWDIHEGVWNRRFFFARMRKTESFESAHSLRYESRAGSDINARRGRNSNVCNQGGRAIEDISGEG